MRMETPFELFARGRVPELRVMMGMIRANPLVATAVEVGHDPCTAPYQIDECTCSPTLSHSQSLSLHTSHHNYHVLQRTP